MSQFSEISLGQQTASQLQSNLVSALVNSYIETTKSTGLLLRKTAVNPVFDTDKQWLSKIVFKQPRYGFILNYGFVGVRSNRRRLTLNPTNHFYNAIERGNVLEELATELSNLRGDAYLANINF